MIRKINTVEDVKLELERYFRTLYALPAVKLPRAAKNHLWFMISSTFTADDADGGNMRWKPTNVDITDCWYWDENVMTGLSKFEYQLLAARFCEKPMPWKVLEHKHNLTRQRLRQYQTKVLNTIYNKLRD